MYEVSSKHRARRRSSTADTCLADQGSASLLHADVGLDADEHDTPAASGLLQRLLHRCGDHRELRLLEGGRLDAIERSDQLRHRVAEALGILLSQDDRDFERFGRLDQPVRARHHRAKLVDVRRKLLLDITDRTSRQRVSSSA